MIDGTHADGTDAAGIAALGTGTAGRDRRLPPLLAIAHGSRDPRAAAAVAELLDRVRRRSARRGMPELEVVTAYLDHAPPSPAQVLGALYGGAGPSGASPALGGTSLVRAWAASGPTSSHRADAVVALPLLLTDAYHSKTDIPSVLRAAAASRPGLQIRYGQPLGPHPLLISAMERHLARAGVPIGDPGTAVVLAAAGSTDPAATAVISRLAKDWRGLRGWSDVVPAFASAAPPSPAAAVAALRRSGAANVVVASYLLAPGVFADKVRETSLAAGATAVSDVLAPAPELADLVLLRYAAASTAVSHLEPAANAARSLA